LADPRQSNSKARITSIRKVRSLFGRPSMSRGWIRRQIWAAPLLALAGMLFAGVWVRGRMEKAILQQKQNELTTLLQADVQALDLWMDSQADYVDSAAHSAAIQKPIFELLKVSEEVGKEKAALLQSRERAELEVALQTALKPWLDDPEYVGYALLDKDGRIVAANDEILIGQSPARYQEFAKTVLAGKAMVTRPFKSVVALADEAGGLSVGVPTMFAAAPVKDGAQSVAVIGFRLQPSDDFTKILNVARTGKSGETYAFDKFGLFLSASRFEEELNELNPLQDQSQVRSTLNWSVRDPGVNVMDGERPALPPNKRPLIHMAADAIKNRPTIDNPPAAVYRDYRGVEVIGVWAWLPKYDFGVTTEVDRAEAFAPLAILRGAFWTLFGLLSVATLLLLGMAIITRRLERRMREAVIAAGQVGQYALEEKIGEGGMGSVFRGRHAMLRRPTAIKLLEPSKTTDVSIERFEREVQHTSQLNHPNTITIYDYGRTDEGVFYYAMEYLDGLSLQSLVERFGSQPDGRVVQILLQVCGSLAEAHSQGLIHRDIKPANIMLTERGGVRDYVKLLDFGLVKAIDANKQRSLTAADSITGTPLYLPPESIQDSDRSDVRSDLYSLGGVAYFLLTGHPVFETGGVMEIIRQHVEGTPVPLSKRLGKPVGAEFEALVLKCLAKAPDSRPQSALEVADALARCMPLEPWTAADANRWWHQELRGRAMDDSETATQTIALARTLGQSEFDRSP
jgi:hypothetical protein